MPLKLEDRYLKGFVSQHEYQAIQHQVEAAHQLLESGKGPGSDFLGWTTLPRDYDKEEFARIQAAAKKIQGNSDVFVVIGIGGSYLGARAAIEFLKSEKYNDLRKDTPGHLLHREFHQLYRPGGAGADLRGERRLHQYDLQVRHHHRAGHRLPGVPGAAGEKVRQRGRQGAHLLHHR